MATEERDAQGEDERMGREDGGMGARGQSSKEGIRFHK